MSSSSSGSHDFSGPFVTRSRRMDLALLLVFLTMVIGTAPWLRVYHRITAFEMTLVEVGEHGERQVLDLPSELDIRSFWTREPSEVLSVAQGRFNRFAARAAADPAQSGTHYELTLDYSFNSPALDQSVTWRAP